MQKFDCFSHPATIGPRWKRWLTSFELYADGKGLIITIRVLAHKGDSKGEIRYLINVVYWNI